ncbi:class I SAM-dependent methyltransferase [Adhaeretor mobilis]|uniref:Methyltransferase domain-containing protein n=1 Tax=Adhaeretor mobilis TaxID=1930276 RepID=A0A517MUG2_9BACT|nr:class I SAM-dependent methyltransferase [Adhaeretor mobilis]QDS98518.1 hypothetical protein HG15A2_17990 [Adhaeretor mobilis]
MATPLSLQRFLLAGQCAASVLLTILCVLPILSRSAFALEAVDETTKLSNGFSQPGIYMGRQIAPPMSYSGADWLTRRSRAQEERPGELYDFLKLKAGQHVCDFGCGNGYHAFEMSKRVGPRGKVYAVDIQSEMLDKLKRRTESRGIKNIHPILAKPKEPRLPVAALDLILMVDVYHELSDPPTVLAQVKKSLKADGRLVLVEFREEDRDVPIRPLHKMSKSQVHRELTSQAFVLSEQYDQLPWQHVLVFGKKADKKRPAVKLAPWAANAEEDKTKG